MTRVVRLVTKSELERERLLREARAIYDSIFPSYVEPADVCSKQTAPRNAIADTSPNNDWDEDGAREVMAAPQNRSPA